MSKTKSVFTKENSVALKGAAILMLVFFHCFSSPARYEGKVIDFAPLGEHWIMIISSSCKMCVSIFAFVTGYGLYLSLKHLNSDNKWSTREISKWTVERYIKLMSGFWVIAVLAFVICQLIDGRTYDYFFDDTSISGAFKGVIRMLISLSGLSDYFDVRTFCKTWWYMSLAIILVITAPVCTKLIDRFKTAPVLALMLIIPRILKIPFKVNTFTVFGVIFVVGMVFAKYNLMVRFANVKWIKCEKYSKLDKPVKFAGMTALMLFLVYTYYCFPLWIYEVRLVLIPAVVIIYLYEFFLDTIFFRKVLYFCGRHSMNIFLTHTFIRAIYLEDFTYSFQKWWLIPLVLFVLSLLLSMCIELLKKLIRYDEFTKKLIDKVLRLVDKAYDKIPLYTNKKGEIKCEKVS